MADLTGQSMGHYRVLEQLGEGGMAAVYKAFDTVLERDVALKVILSEEEQSDTFLKRFQIEAKTLAKLSHPNIVPIIDYGSQSGIPYLVMPCLPGGTLKQRLTGRPMPWPEAAQLLLPIARALAYAHGRKVIHRDVKPGNILITESGEPMLSDFGIAKLMESGESLDLTGSGVGIGTPEYMSPEQALGNPVDGRSDLYSLAIVFYEMVTGRRPYEGDTPYSIAIKQATEPLPRPTLYVPDLPATVEAFLVKALAKKPDERFRNMNEFAVALQNLGRTNTATVVVPAPRSTRGGDRARTGQRNVLAALASSVVVIGGFGAVLLCVVAFFVARSTPSIGCAFDPTGPKCLPTPSAPPPTQSAVSNIRMTTDRSGNTTTSTYAPGDTFYLFADLNGLSKGSIVEAKWYAVNAQGLSPDTELNTSDYTYESGISYLYFRLTTNDGSDWPSGSYKVDLFLDGAQVGEQVFIVARSPSGTSTGALPTATPVSNNNGTTTFTDQNNEYQIDVPADWTHKNTTGDGFYWDTFTSPDEGAVIENYTYLKATSSDGTPWNADQQRQFALQVLDEYYSKTGKPGDIEVTEEKPQSDGSVRLTWDSKTGDYSGLSFFEMRGTSFLFFTVDWGNSYHDKYIDTLNKVIESYRVP